MNLPFILGLGAAGAGLAALLRRAEEDARVALALGCRCAERKAVLGSGGRYSLG